MVVVRRPEPDVLWVLVGVPAFAVGWATMGAMGEVVGEAWGGDFLHALGHTLGSGVLVALLSVAGWLPLRGRVAWASRWARAASLGAGLGCMMVVPCLAFAPESLAGLNLALTLHLPLVGSATAQGLALRGRLRHPGRWAFAWYLAVLAGVAVAWFSGGGLAGVQAYYVHPVLPRALEYWWRMVPRSLLGGVAYTTATVVLLSRASFVRQQRHRPLPRHDDNAEPATRPQAHTPRQIDEVELNPNE